MINGAHAIIYSKDSEADRNFFRDVLGFNHVDVGRGWLIFALPASEAAVHPGEANNVHELYLMCDNLQEEIAGLSAKGVACDAVVEAAWGSVTKIQLPGGGHLGLYQPKYARP